MTNPICSGNQDRNTTTSETHPNRPPSKTRNCYRTNDFDRSGCGTNDDGACIGKGLGPACISDNNGGYCKYGDKFYESAGPAFVELKTRDLLDRYRSGTGSGTGDSREVRRALNDQERRFTNRIRELQIMGKNPLVKRNDTEGGGEESLHGFVGDMLFNIGIGISVIIFLISISIILIQNQII